LPAINIFKALQIFAREIYPAATAMAQGLTGFAGGRPEPQPVVRLFSFLADKADVPVSISTDGKTRLVRTFVPNDASAGSPVRSGASASDLGGSFGPSILVPLIALAHGRSGDKGDVANIGVLARRPEFLDLLRAQLTPSAVRDYFAHYAGGDVDRFDWPGLSGLNILLHRSLGGGGVASLRHDPQGKALAQVLMDFPVAVPAGWLEPGGPLNGWSETLIPDGNPAGNS